MSFLDATGYNVVLKNDSLHHISRKNIEEVNEWILEQEDKDQYTIETVKGLLHK